VLSEEGDKSREREGKEEKNAESTRCRGRQVVRTCCGVRGNFKRDRGGDREGKTEHARLARRKDGGGRAQKPKLEGKDPLLTCGEGTNESSPKRRSTKQTPKKRRVKKKGGASKPFKGDRHVRRRSRIGCGPPSEGERVQKGKKRKGRGRVAEVFRTKASFPVKLRQAVRKGKVSGEKKELGINSDRQNQTSKKIRHDVPKNHHAPPQEENKAKEGS